MCDDCGCGCFETSITSTQGARGATGATGLTGATGPQGIPGQSSNTHDTINETGTGTILDASSTGSTVYFNNASGGEVTLPTEPADGTYFNFEVMTTVTSNSYTIAAGGGDKYTGYLFGGKSASTDTIFLASAALTDHTITMNGGSTGGKIGTSFTMTYREDGSLWYTSGKTYGAGVLQTPFS